MKIGVIIKDPNVEPGGLDQFFKYFAEYLENLGHTLLYDFSNTPVDLMFLTHSNSGIATHGLRVLEEYLIQYPSTIFVHRINKCDEHFGFNGENEKTLRVNTFANYTVFISSFVRDLYTSQGFDRRRPHSIILNGADERIFNPSGRSDWKQGDRLRIITHHWSTAYNKGFDIYARLDSLLGLKPFSELFEFTFVGNLPKDLRLKNTQVVSPLRGSELAKVIKHHHVYLTASRNEAAGMHHIEGMRCGLPVLYLNSGALPEYCSSYGVEFTVVDFEKKLLTMVEHYPALRERVLHVPYTAASMCSQYETLFSDLLRRERQKTSSAQV
jgi:glycosyltransferase involved in cell wall biosynthesis